MHPSNSSLDRDDEKSDEQLEQSRNTAAVQHAADTMIAVTESYRHHYRDRLGSDGFPPQLPERTYSHSRSSSRSSSSSHMLLDQDPLSMPQIAPLSRTSSTSSTQPLNPTSIPSILVPGYGSIPESQTLLQREREQPETSGITLPDELVDSLRLATPSLPPRLDTPRTPPIRHSHPAAVPPPPESRLYDDPSPPDRRYSDTEVDHGGVVHAARDLEDSNQVGYQYMALRPDMGNETLRFGTVTHIQSGADAQVSKEVRRKPLAPGTQTLKFNHSSNEILFVSVICLAHALSLAGLAQALVPARDLAKSFSDEPSKHANLAWYSAAYALTTGVFILPGARLGSIWGHKQIFVFGYVWFGFWSLIAGLSVWVSPYPTAFFCFSRAMQGIGPALLLPTGQAMLRRAYPPGRRKMLALALWYATAPAGFVVGAVMASLLAGYADWKWAFYSLAAVCLASAALSTLSVPGKNVQMHNLDGPLWVRLDCPAVLCGTTGVMLFCIGWNVAPVVWFDSPTPYVLIILGLLLIPPYIYFEARAPLPLVPFCNMCSSAGIVLTCTACIFASWAIWVWYLIRFLETTRNWTALHTSAGLMPLLITGLVAAIITPPLMTNTPPAFPLLLASLAALASCILLATCPSHQSYWLAPFFSALLAPLAPMLCVPAAVSLLSGTLPEGHQGLPEGCIATVMGVSMALGWGIAGVVERASGETGARWFGAGIAVLGTILALGMVCARLIRR